MSVEFANRTLEGEFGRKANSRALKPIFGGPRSTWYVPVQCSPSSGPDAFPASDFLYLAPYNSAPWCLWWALCIWIKPFPIAIRAFQTVFKPGNPFLPNWEYNKILHKMLLSKTDEGRTALAEKVLPLPWWGSLVPIGLLEVESETRSPLLTLTQRPSFSSHPQRTSVRHPWRLRGGLCLRGKLWEGSTNRNSVIKIKSILM